MTLAWIETPQDLIPARSHCGLYVVRRYVGGRSGPVYRAHFIGGLNVTVDLGELRNTLAEAQDDAQAHRDSLEVPA